MDKMVVGEVKTDLARFEWEIDIECFKGKAVGEKIMSPKFYTRSNDESNEEWILELYPKGDEFDNGYVSLFLKHYGKNTVHISGYLTLLNQNDQKVKFWLIHKTGFEGNDCWGHEEFIKESFVMDQKNNLLKNNKLKILCKIVIEKNSKVVENKMKSIEVSCRLKEMDKFEKLLTNNQFSDITIKAQEKNFYLHKNILSISSDVFEAMFRSDMIESNQNTVTIEDVDPDVLEEFFRFIYTGKVLKIKERVNELLIAAEKYNIKELKVLCEQTMIKCLSEDNAVMYLQLAIENNAEQLKVQSIHWIAIHLENMIEIKELEEFGIKYPKVMFDITKNHVNL